MSKTYTKEQAEKRQNEIRTYFNRRSIRHQLECLMRTFAPKRGNDLRLALNTNGGSYTDGRNVVVGLFDFMWPLRNGEIYSCLKALTAHETAHVLFTNMEERKAFCHEVGEYFHSRHGIHKKVGEQLGATLSNIIEDGRIEYKMVNRYPGILKHLKFMRGIWWENCLINRVNKETGQIEKSDAFGAWINSVLTLATTGVYPKDFDPIDYPEVFDLVTKQTPYIRDGVYGNTHTDCINACWNLIKASEDYLAESMKKHSESAEQMEKFMEMLKELMDDMLKEGGAPMMGDSGNDEDGDGDDSEGQNGGGMSVHFDMSTLGEPGDDKKGSGGGSQDEQDEENGKDKDEKGDGSGSGEKQDEEKDKDGNGSGDKNDEMSDKEKKEQAKEQAKNAKKQSPKVSKSKENLQKEMKSLSDEAGTESDKSLARIDNQEKMEEKAKKAKENEGRADFNQINGDFGFVPDFEIESFTPKRANVPSDIKLRGRTMRKMFEKLLKNENDFAYTGQKRGTLNTSALWRYNMGETNIFMKKVVESPSYAVSLLVDGSGSMATRTIREGVRSTRYEDAMVAAATIEEALNGLVPLSVTVFDDNYGTTCHREVRRFKPSKLNHSWSFFEENPYPFSANRDGYSIRVVGEELLLRPETTKILFVISDGQPAAHNFNYGVDETAKAVKTLKDKGLIVIALSIGMNELSSRDYQEALLDYQKMYEKDLIVADPSQISNEISRLLKELLK